MFLISFSKESTYGIINIQHAAELIAYIVKLIEFRIQRDEENQCPIV